MTRAQEPLEELIDALIYAPIGIVLDIVDNYPEHVARGRRQVEMFEKLGGAVLRGFGFGASGRASGSSPSAPTQPLPTSSEPSPDRSSDATVIDAEIISDDAQIALVDADLAVVTVVAETSSALVDADLETILGGTVGEVRDAIEGLSAPVVRDLIELEQAGKNRVTVLRAAHTRLEDLGENPSDDAR